ncbi:hypothetical protein SAMN05216337_1010147 [Bradyrhizobium brasilense]|uniref:Uncharacterized protein n=1 Tax=Bradyrhizobium brasilense TaxID=1419277 RepID=A0A1G6U9H2_9BRAD|nr:hypothetical protein SAMN05216337_1010147 [Bradyrhizobium brasilense]
MNDAAVRAYKKSDQAFVEQKNGAIVPPHCWTTGSLKALTPLAH